VIRRFSRPRDAGLALTVALSAALLSITSQSPAQAPPRPVLVELFTAEGCSSCPPADHLLEQLDASQPIPGAHLIVLSEHVDYWDGQGWPDPYASKAFTERQVAYERSLKVSEPFTPQFVVDGTVDMRLSRRERIGGQLNAAAASVKIPVSIESASVSEGSSPTIDGSVRVEGAQGPCELFVAVALDHADSQVLRGENRGQHLTHVAVLVALSRIGSVAAGDSSRQSFSLPLRPGLEHSPLRVIAFVQRPGPGAVVGAAERTTGS
jgi:hypothetical protein